MSIKAVVAIAPNEQHRKTASLFFDYMMPLMGPRDYPDSVVVPGWEKYDQFKNLRASFERAKRDLDWRTISDEDEFAREVLTLISNYLTASCAKELAADGIRSAPFFMSSRSYDSYCSAAGDQIIEMEVQDVPLINADRMGWDQIEDVRADPDFRQKIRDFRLFLHENYEGKSRTFICEDLDRRLDQYKAICKKHGLEMKLAVIKEALNSKSLGAGLVLTAVGLLVGDPLLAGGSLLTGAIVEAGKLAVTVARKKAAMRFSAKESPISYLYDLKQVVAEE